MKVFNRFFFCFILFTGFSVLLIAEDYPEAMIKAEKTFETGGQTHGITFDRDGNLYAGRSGIRIIKITPEGKVIPFAELEGIGTSDIQKTYISSFDFGPDGFLYAAAGDRILKISPEGKISNLIRENYPGTYGAVDIEFDRQGNFYVSYERKIVRYSPKLEKIMIIDGERYKDIDIQHIIGIKFDDSCRNLYFNESYNGRVIGIPFGPDGKTGKPFVIFEEPFESFEFVSYRSGNVILIGPDADYFFLIGKKSTKKIILKHDENKGLRLETVVFGINEHDQNTMYGTSLRYGNIYKIDMSSVIEK